jgi:putative tricarboxylic transport membrane protein
VLALVLGGMMEQSFRQSMTISGSSPQIFFGSALTMTLATIAAFILALTFYKAVTRKPRPMLADAE